MTATVNCIDCELADLQGSRSMARLGFALCRRKEKWHFEGLTRPQTCPTFKPAPPERAAERRAWLTSQRGGGQ